MNGKDVLSEPHGPRPDTQETSPFLTANDDHFYLTSHNENTGGSAVNVAAIRRNEQEGKIIVHKSSLHVLIEYSMQEIMARCLITSLRTSDN